MATPKTKTKAKTAPGVKIPGLVDMLEAGVHFGHERSKKNPNMDNYIFMLRNRVAIIDLEKTHDALTAAAKAMHKLCQDPSKEILFVGTKRQTRPIMKKYAEAAGMPYVTQRWIGGMLTNFSTVLKSIEKLDELKSLEDTPAMNKMTKKERSVHAKEIERLENILEGTKNLRKPPAALFVVGSHDEKLAVKEANRVDIPVFAVTDTNANPKLVTYPIPANDDAIRSIDLICRTMSQAILTARGKNLDDILPEETAPEPVADDTDEENTEEAETTTETKTETKEDTPASTEDTETA